MSQDALTRILNDFPVIDGFSFDTNLRCDLQFENLAIQQYDALRRASAYRFKNWLVPKDSTVMIPAFDSYEYQLYLKPGSAIWGYVFWQVAGLSFQLRDSCDDVPLFSEPSTNQTHSSPYQQQYLTKLLIVGHPGTLTVEICNTLDTAQQCQLVLSGGEPA
jgi:hypothetical protein